MPFPDPRQRNPVVLPDGTAHPGTVFLSQVIDQPNFHVGEFSYASDFDPPQDWARHLAPYLFPTSADHLHIGRFCQIAHQVRFLTAGANHAQDGLSCFPFPIFDPAQIGSYQPDTRDTRIGHDVWLGYGALICPGTSIGHGAVIGAGAVVRGYVPDYAIVTGNPGRVVARRFAADEIDLLLSLAWWDWPDQSIAAATPALIAGDVQALRHHAPS